ncbi:MAG: CAP domain-containing protein [Methanothrix sp.]|nr:CAP domain-containing protein [Methanothrix sp.]MDD4447598.1 CAP domain-containing protein [Methanothrix sp.]
MCKLITQISPKKLFAIVFLLLVAFTFAAAAQDQQSPLNDKEKKLADGINQYRTQNGLSAVPITNSLTKVARTHIVDLNTYHPDTKNYGNGDCNTHSWSNKGDWTAVCYTGSAQQLQMHNKPGEITESYDSNGYEIASWSSGEATAEGAIDGWKSSSDHSDVILERNIWVNSAWKAMGVGIDGNYAVVWFGMIADPAGSVPTATANAITSEDYPDVVGPGCTKSYCTDVNVLHRCDHNKETIEPQGCFLGLFGPPNEQFRVGNGPNAFADVYYAEFNVAIVGGTGQAQAAQDAPRLVILIDNTLNNGVDLAQDSEVQINDKPAIRLKDYSSKTTDEGKDKFLYKLPVSYLKTGKNTLKIKPNGDEFSIYKIWIENAKGERIWREKNDPCSYQSVCKFDVRYNPDQLACDFTATPQVCKEKKGSGKPCDKNFECMSGGCSASHTCT